MCSIFQRVVAKDTERLIDSRMGRSNTQCISESTPIFFCIVADANKYSVLQGPPGVQYNQNFVRVLEGEVNIWSGSYAQS
jgi:hypothetical protein